MTKEKLVELLRKYPDDLPVLVHSEGDNQFGEVLRVERSTDDEGDFILLIGD